MNYKTILCDNAVKSGRTVCLTAVGTSMWPVITNGMRAVISPLNSGLPEKGSLLLIKRSNGLMVHRYWGVTYKEGEPLVLTKGDTNLAFDTPMPVSMVVGQVLKLKYHSGSTDPNRGWLFLLGRIICSSYNAASLWARFCRLMLRFQNIGGKD